MGRTYFYRNAKISKDSPYYYFEVSLEFDSKDEALSYMAQHVPPGNEPFNIREGYKIL